MNWSQSPSFQIVGDAGDGAGRYPRYLGRLLDLGGEGCGVKRGSKSR